MADLRVVNAADSEHKKQISTSFTIIYLHYIIVLIGVTYGSPKKLVPIHSSISVYRSIYRSALWTNEALFEGYVKRNE